MTKNEIIEQLFALIEHLSYVGCLLDKEIKECDDLYEEYMKIKEEN